MTDCAKECPHELGSKSNTSPGVVESEEIIFRGSYDPMHYRKSKLTGSFIRKGDLLKGELSVWRASAKTGCSPRDIAQIVANSGPPENRLAALHGATASDIRDLRAAWNNSRLFCVVDETETDAAGGHHAAHAHIRFCESQLSYIDDGTNGNYDLAKEQLVLLLRQTTLAANEFF